MLRIKTKDLPVGARLRHDIYNQAGQLLIKKGTSPTVNMIDRLHKLGITEVYVYQEASSTTSLKFDDTHLIRSFVLAQQAVSQLAQQILNETPLEIPIVDQAVQGIYPEVLATNNVIKYLHKLHQANEYTLDHSVAVSMLSVKIAQCIGLDKEQVKAVALAGLLHDIGKYKIAKEIINKPGPLSEEEKIEIQKHPVYGYRVIQSMRFGNQEIALAVLQHHEYMNGRGYPVGLTGDKIHLFARIIAVADVFDAMTSIRSYSQSVTPFKAAKEMRRSCFGQLDVHITRRFLLYVLNVSSGDHVFLNNGETAQVVMFNFNNPTRPLVKTNSRFIDLEQEKDFDIIKVL